MWRWRILRVADGPDELMDALEAHAWVCQRQLARKPLPPLYRSGVRYRRARKEDTWRTPRQVLERGAGHCPDLACWRVAELRLSGEDPHATVMVRRGGAAMGHVVVRRGDGTQEDPSRILGMKGGL